MSERKGDAEMAAGRACHACRGMPDHAPTCTIVSAKVFGRFLAELDRPPRG